MIDKNSSPQTALSFERLLTWVGRFTPQFKFQLMGLRRQLDLNEFDLFLREAFTVFRSLLVDIGAVQKGPARARRVYELIDKEHRLTPPTGISCASGCGACCRQFPKQITDDEADLLAGLVNDGSIAIDLMELKRQAQALSSPVETERKSGLYSACLFLSEDNRCRVYVDRPAVCRKYHVTSPASQCASDSETGVVPHIDLMPELIVSAAISLPDNGTDLMPLQLAKRLPDLNDAG